MRGPNVTIACSEENTEDSHVVARKPVKYYMAATLYILKRLNCYSGLLELHILINCIWLSLVCYSISAYRIVFKIYLETTTTVLQTFFWDHPGELVPEDNLWTLRCKGRLTDTNHPAGHHSIRTKQCPPPPSPIFYRPDALPAAQPIVLKGHSGAD